jgi:starch-binding outer membrane protein, SusD/RagB family
MKNKLKYIIILLTVIITFSACSKDEYLNPSQAAGPSVVSDINGLIALANGLQFKYSVGRTSPVYSVITASGLSAKELNVLNQGNTDEANLQAGSGNVAGSNAVVSRLWEQCNLIRSNAKLITDNIKIVGDPTLKNNLLSYANLFNGMALLHQGTFWEQAPSEIKPNASFSKRIDVLKAALKLFEDGAALGVNAVDARFIGGIDFPSTFNAMIARTALMLGEYTKAIDAATKNDGLSKKSVFTYDAVSRNPIFDVCYSNANVYEPLNVFLGLPSGITPDTAADKRVTFYLKNKVFTALNDGKGFFSSNTDGIPLFLPGEMTLIKAECYARTMKLTEAVTELNKVLTKTAATDLYGVGAALPAYTGATTDAAILTEIYRNRCIELYNSGLRLEDSRRFNRDQNTERSRNFYPYPTNERDNNTNTPADPVY